jgi:S-DNA-T family DNA segregation ATPase FtsK/SpoIIIE
MGIGYGRAARLIDFMAEDGYVGPYNGAKAREVMMTPEQWENIRTGGDGSEFEEDDPETDSATVIEAAKPTLPPKKAPPSPKSRLLKNLADTRASQLAANAIAPAEEEIEDDEDEYEIEDELDSDEQVEEADDDSDEEEYEVEYEAADGEYEDVEDDEEYEYEDEDEEEED